jgi:dTDP-4-dehydrorhamnose 3,5-epimerase
MEFIETGLKGAYLVRIQNIEDERGHFGRAWCREEFGHQNLNPHMVQMNVGFNHRRGTLRGMHYQLAPHAEAKYIRCTRGAIYDVIIDLREDSPTIGRWYGAELAPENGLMLYAPEGCAHGYQTLQDDTEMFYLTSAPYAPSAARGVRHDSPAFGIRWPLPVTLISATDRQWPEFPFQKLPKQIVSPALAHLIQTEIQI